MNSKWLCRTAIAWLHRMDLLGVQVIHRGRLFEATKSWAIKWVQRQGYVSRSIKQRRHYSPAAMEVIMIKWAHFLSKAIDPLGAFPLTNRLNVDQAPLNLDNQRRTTFVTRASASAGYVHQSGTKPGNKRFATLQVAIGPTGLSPILFKQISNTYPAIS